MMEPGQVATGRNRCSTTPGRSGARLSTSRAAGASTLRSIRLCDEASLLLRTAGWRKGDLQRKLSALARDMATLSLVDMAAAKTLGKRERHLTRTTSARIAHEDYGRVFEMAAAGGVSVWAFLNQAIIDKHGPTAPL